jgi:hypothetical protein
VVVAGSWREADIVVERKVVAHQGCANSVAFGTNSVGTHALILETGKRGAVIERHRIGRMRRTSSCLLIAFFFGLDPVACSVEV